MNFLKNFLKKTGPLKNDYVYRKQLLCMLIA